MSLDAMLAAHDETALEAVANKGLVRRAQKDVSKGVLDVLERAEDRAVLSVETQTVELTSDGPKRASCTCPANTVCRHIIGAMLFLRDSSLADGEQANSNFATNERTVGAASDQPAIVRAELSALPPEAVSKFAGADLQKALEFAAQHQGATITDQGATSIVRFSDELGTVTFIAGQGLQGAISKGPKSKTRLLVAAAALLLRRAEGVALPELEEASGISSSTASIQLDTAYLNDVLIGLENALTAVMSGTPELAEETLFDLAISARAQAAPRLSSELRRLTKSAHLAREHHIDFSPEAYLQASANTYALVNALIKSPGDNRLTGVLRRNYQPREDLTLMMLGAYMWKAESGARGLTVLGYSSSTREWYSTTNARAAGADPTFTP
ncbi:MAG: hypothetical protein JJ937_17435, partial [Parvibaculum sp.]|uniref:hypothetical protein n=1 Tax=Parvibaculum sp. TaxID=2024848 RepID=UPI001B104A67